jgi:RNA-directed DNA polymerase
MKESYSEEIANHTGPESCEGVREGALEALTGESTGRAIEPRNQVILREADLLMAGGRQHRARRRKGKGVSGSRAVGEPWHVGKLLTRKPGDLGFGPPKYSAGPRCESSGNTTAMNGPEKSDRPIVSKKPANKGVLRCALAELAEKRGLAKGNPDQQTSCRTQSRERLQHELVRMRQAVSSLARYDLRQEPCAVVPPAGICAGAAG